MYQITEEDYKITYKPFDIVTDNNRNVGFVNKVSFNEFQSEIKQAAYSVTWLIGDVNKTSWYLHNELKSHGNMVMHILLSNSEQQDRHHIEMLINSGLKLK